MTLASSPGGLLAGLSNDLADAVDFAARSVVAVHGRRRFPGSGLVWRPDRVLTAAHVLERDEDLAVSAPDGSRYAARLVGREQGTDLAILAVEGGSLDPYTRTATPAQPGHVVLAVGRPGTAQPIASFGVVSSIGGAWRTAQGGVLDGYVRADVALLPGLSGGGLVDVHGHVVGLLSAHLAGGDPVAIPAAVLETLAARIEGGGAQKRAFLGVSTQPVELQTGLRERLGIPESGGLMLLSLEPGAPAERDGLLLGDIILSIGGRSVEDGEALQMALGPEVVGAPTWLRIIRGGQMLEVSVTPAARPS